MGSEKEQQRDGHHGERPSVEWERAVQTFTEDGYTVQIDRLPLGRPRFSVSVGILRDGSGGLTNFTSRISARYLYAAGEVKFETLPLPGLIDRLIDKAAEWIETEVQASEVRWQERQQRRQR